MRCMVLAAAAASLALVVQDGGHRLRLQRDLAAGIETSSGRRHAIGEAMGWSLAATIAAAASALAIGPILAGRRRWRSASLVVGNLGKAANGFASSALRARGAFAAEGRLQVERQALVGVVTLAAVILWPHVLTACIAACAAQLATLLLPRERGALAPPRPGRPMLWLMSIAVLTVGYLRVDLIVLGYHRGRDRRSGRLRRPDPRYRHVRLHADACRDGVLPLDPSGSGPVSPAREIAGLCAVLSRPGGRLCWHVAGRGRRAPRTRIRQGVRHGRAGDAVAGGGHAAAPFNFIMSQILIAAIGRERWLRS